MSIEFPLYDNGVPCHHCGGTGRLYPFPSRPWWEHPWWRHPRTDWPVVQPWINTTTSDRTNDAELDKDDEVW